MTEQLNNNNKACSTVCVRSRVPLCSPRDCSPPGSSVHGIFQARVLEWVAISSSKGSSRPRDQTAIACDSCTGRQIFTDSATWEVVQPVTLFKN